MLQQVYTTRAQMAQADYYRQLDIENATGTVCYKNSDKSVTYKREYIASYPDKAVVWHYEASEEGKISLRFSMASGEPGIVATTTYSDGTASFSGSLQTISYAAHLKVVPEGGTMKTTDSGIVVENANSVLVVLVGITDFVADQILANVSKYRKKQPHAQKIYNLSTKYEKNVV